MPYMCLDTFRYITRGSFLSIMTGISIFVVLATYTHAPTCPSPACLYPSLAICTYILGCPAVLSPGQQDSCSSGTLLCCSEHHGWKSYRTAHNFYIPVVRAGHSLIFSRFPIRSPLNFVLWIADAHAFIFGISLFARRSNARRSTSSSLSEKRPIHSLLSINIWIIW